MKILVLGGTISLAEIIRYVETKCKCRVEISETGDSAPYNGQTEFSINTDLAKSIGFIFSPLKNWIYDLLDKYIAM